MAKQICEHGKRLDQECLACVKRYESEDKLRAEITRLKRIIREMND